MCGRVHKPDPNQLLLFIQEEIDEHGWRLPRQPPFLVDEESGYGPGEGFPTNVLPILREAGDDWEMIGTRWGVRPAWSRRDLINTRQETMTEKSTWSKAFRQRRCAVPVAGFYEWSGPKGSRQRHWIYLPDSLMVLAGLWADHPEYGPCTSIVTTAAGDVVAPIHDRQPVILPAEEVPRWLDGGIQERGPLEDLLEPYAGIVEEPVDGPLDAVTTS